MKKVNIREPNSWQHGPHWIRKRALGRQLTKTVPRSSIDLIQRLKQEACLEGHSGCVNCLEWNQQGDLLASGSDDCRVIIWNAFKNTKQTSLHTGHQSTIFSVKFMPASDDTQIATCGADSQVRVTGVLNAETLLVCRDCHTERVKRLAVHPSEPYLIWSASEDGHVMQYDIREQHVCKFSKSKNLLIDLNTLNTYVMAKCITVNPMRSEMLAVGSNDIYNRLFDRRYLLNKSGTKCCTAYFAPGHLHKTNNRSNNLQSYGTTYLAFNSDGSELLASVHAEQVYLYKTYEPWERYRSFEASIKPLLLDQPQCNSYKSLTKLQPFSYLDTLRRSLWPAAHLPKTYVEIFRLLTADEELQNINYELDISGDTLEELNKLIIEYPNAPDLYRGRARALVRRNWRGDYYQALRDCCCALALNPLDWKTVYCLSSLIVKIDDLKSVCGLLEFVENAIAELGPDKQLDQSRDLLLEAKHSPSPTQSRRSFDDDIENEHTNLSGSSGRLSMIDDRHPMYTVDSAKALTELAKRELAICFKSNDFSKRFSGHSNMNTDIKEANFFGANDEFIVGGSDDGAFYIWDKKTSNLVKAVDADYDILNCVQPHPSVCMLATSGTGVTVKLWSPSGTISRDVEPLHLRCERNARYISMDPLDYMISRLYPSMSQ